jgi:DNA-binding SARP family transcriptional activator
MEAGGTGSPAALEFDVLGALEVWRGERPVRLGGERQRGLVAALLLNVNEVVPAERLIEDLYGGDPSGTAANALQAMVSRLRRLLEDETGDDANHVVVTRSPGYLLRVDPEQVDATRFERLAAEGRDALAAGDPVRAGGLLRDGLALWRGPPFVDLPTLEFVQGEARRLEELRLATLMDRIDADLAVGRPDQLVPELEALVGANPLQERPRAQLMLALYRAGRQADALTAYRETRAHLRDELGLEPSKALQQLERAILTQDAALDAPARTVTRALEPARVAVEPPPEPAGLRPDRPLVELFGRRRPR